MSAPCLWYNAAVLLSLRGVQKRFGALQALHNVTCEVDGRAVGLLGPNGAGKTTLMRICLGLLPADSGEVAVLGLDARRDPFSVRARLGYAAEGPDRIPGLSGLESVAYAAELCGLPRRTALLRAHEMLDLVGLDESRSRPVEEYSTGMHQRVKIAMALVHDPELLLLDEPTSGLDPGSRDELLDLLVRLRDGDGPAVILSTHLLHDVERTCDSCVIMDRGQVHFSGTLESLRRRGEQPFVLRVDGDANPLWHTLAQAGHQVAAGRRPGELVVQLSQGSGPPAIWACAQHVSARLIHMQRKELSLEEAFLSTVGTAGGAV
ncbi:MAG: ABC transporter ATP-binding protein [Myxococcota bacterium]